MVQGKVVLLCHLCVLLLCAVMSSTTELPESTSVNEVRGYFKREHSLSKPYQAAGVSMINWDITGHTIITPQYIRLTPDQKSLEGGLWNSVPCQSRDWEFVVTFKVHGSTGDLFGDGMAIWYVKEPAQIGPVFGYKDFFQGLGIIMDTYNNYNGPHNHGHPYTSAIVNNGTLHYDHDADGTHTELAGCQTRFRNKDYDTSLLIRYVDDTVSVYSDVKNKGVWEKCFVVPGVRLPEGYYFGMTALTGDLSDNHDIITIRMYELDVPRAEKRDEANRMDILPFASNQAAPRDHVSDSPPPRLGWIKTIFLILIAVVATVAFLYVGVTFFQKRQEKTRKRFY